MSGIQRILQSLTTSIEVVEHHLLKVVGVCVRILRMHNVSNPTYYDGTTKVAPTDNLKPGDEIINSDRPIYFTVTVDGWIDTNPDVYM